MANKKKPTVDEVKAKKAKTPYNRNGFHTKNFTQLLSNKTSGMERAITETTEATPSGEQGLPSIH